MLALAFILVTRPSIHGNDGVQNYAYLRSLMFDGDLNFDNEYEYFISRQADWFDRKQIPRDPVTDLPINLYGVGSSILWAPWIFIAHGTGHLMNAAGANLKLDGYSALYAAGVSYGSSFYATLGLVLIFRRLRSFAGHFSATWALLLIWLASPLFFYMYLHPSMSHSNSFFLVSLMLVLYLARPASLIRWALLGLTCGLMTITRYQDGIIMLAMAVGELWDWKHADNRWWPWLKNRIPLYATWCVAFALAISPQIVAWGILQGAWFSGPRAYVQQGDFSFLSPAYVPQVLFSSQHGVFYWHPALLLALAGLFIAGAFLREKLMSLTAFAAQTWVVASWSIWWAGASFGHRMFISTLPFLAIGALFTVGRHGRSGLAMRLLLLFLVAWNFGCIIQYGLGWIARQEGVPLQELAYNNFVRLPGLVLGRVLPGFAE
jgi:hypothetical protein